MSTADEIKKLNDLLRDGILSQEEFDKQKDKLLNSRKIFLKDSSNYPVDALKMIDKLLLEKQT